MARYRSIGLLDDPEGASGGGDLVQVEDAKDISVKPETNIDESENR